jgi:hypothetical protein
MIVLVALSCPFLLPIEEVIMTVIYTGSPG